MKSTKQLTLIERFNQTGEAPPWFQERHPGVTYYPERSEMRREIANLLNSLFDFGRCSNPELLAEYERQFDWDTKYWVSVKWELYSPTCEQEIECESEEELFEYLEYLKEVEEPDNLDDYRYEQPSIKVEKGRTSAIHVSNLRLKQQKHRYSVVLVVESDTPVEDNAIPSVLSALSQGESWEIVSSTQVAAAKGM